MKERQHITEFKEYRYDELPEGDRALVDAAKRMTLRSYAPWSKFHVGAAILLDDGTVVTGSNQENVAFPSGTCAERSACYYAGANYPDRKFVKIAVAARNLSGADVPEDVEAQFVAEPCSPCGACRQALLEYETLHGPVEVILYGRERVYVLPSVASLLPFCFSEF